MTITFLSDLLKYRYPGLAEHIDHISKKENAIVRVINNTRDIWIRDYMPVMSSKGKLVKFKYRPSYLVGEFESLITEERVIKEGFEFSFHQSKIIADGGNFIWAGEKLLICDRVFEENPQISREELLQRLRYLLDAKDIIVLPTHPLDPLGHADGVVYHIKDNEVLIDGLGSNATEVDIKYFKNLRSILTGAGFHIIEAPVCDMKVANMDEWDARGSYVNITRIGRTLLLPVFKDSRKDELMNFYITLFRSDSLSFIGIDSLAKEGGGLHCVTWTV